MKIVNLGNENSVVNNFIAELRDVEIQKDSMRFRRNIERIGEVLSYELSKNLNYNELDVNTPLDVKSVNVIKDKMVLCSVLRAGLTLHQGILNYFDFIENGFISAYRHHTTDDDFYIKVEYLASPSLKDKVLILADPMLATGKSLVAVYESLKKLGKPKQIHIVSVIASEQGISHIEENFPKNTSLWVATVDDKLNNRGYIVPGLGDAGDLAFGVKI